MNPTHRERVERTPRHTAAPLPGLEQLMTEIGTASDVVASTTSIVLSVHPLSTTTIVEDHGCTSR